MPRLVIGLVAIMVLTALVLPATTHAAQIGVLLGVSSLDPKYPTLTQLSEPRGVAVANGDVIIADTENDRVLRLSADGQRITVIAGTGEHGSQLLANNPKLTELSHPCGVAVTETGDIIIADTGNARVLRLSADGQQIAVIVGTGERGDQLNVSSPTLTELSFPQSVAVSKSGDVIIADTENRRVLRLSADGQRIVIIVGTGFQGDQLTPNNLPHIYPTGVAVTNSGDIIISDVMNNCVLRLSADGKQIEVIAGTGKCGDELDPNNPTLTQLNGPDSVAVSETGDVIITEMWNRRVLRLSADGKRIEVIAGTGHLRSHEPTEGQLNHNSAFAVAVSKNGDVIIADTWNHRVLRLSTDGQRISLIAGTGDLPSRLNVSNPVLTKLWNPEGVAVKKSGDVIITDRYNARVLRLSADGQRIAVIAQNRLPSGEFNPNNPMQTELLEPCGVAVTKSGDVIITDRYNARVLRLSADGQWISVIAGTGSLGDELDPDSPTKTQLDSPRSVAMTRTGDVIIVDTENHRVLRLSADGRRIAVIAGTGESGSHFNAGNPVLTQLNHPHGVAVSKVGDIIITDTRNHRVLRMSADGERISVIAGTGTWGDKLDLDNHRLTQLNRPSGVAVTKSGDIIISDAWNNRVLRLSADGQRIAVIVGTGQLGDRLNPNDPTLTQLNNPRGVAVTESGDILIADTDNHRVLILSEAIGSELGTVVASARKALSVDDFAMFSRIRNRLRDQIAVLNLLTHDSGSGLQRLFRGREAPATEQNPNPPRNPPLEIFMKIRDFVCGPPQQHALVVWLHRRILARIQVLARAHELNFRNLVKHNDLQVGLVEQLGSFQEQYEQHQSAQVRLQRMHLLSLLAPANPLVPIQAASSEQSGKLTREDEAGWEASRKHARGVEAVLEEGRKHSREEETRELTESREPKQRQRTG